MASTKQIVRSPYLGMETRPGMQKPGHCELAINVDFSDGTIRSRPGFTILNHESTPVTGMFCQEHRSGRRFIWVIRTQYPTPTVPGGHTRLYCYTQTGGEWRPFQNIPNLAPSRNQFTMAELDDVIYFSNGAGPVYYIDPDYDLFCHELIAEAGQYQNSYPYLTTTLRAGVLVNHEGLMLYGKLPAYQTVPMFSALASPQDMVDESFVVGVGRDKLRLGPQVLAWADQGNPAAVTANSILPIRDGEPMTAAASLNGIVYIFTRTSIRQAQDLFSGADPTIQQGIVSSVVGCVSHRTLCRIGDSLVFLAEDGVYTLDSVDGLRKVSEALNQLFQARWNPTTPRRLWRNLALMGFPLRLAANTSAAATVLVRHGYYLCTLSSQGRGTKAFDVTLAWHYPSDRWSIWMPVANSEFRPQVWASFKSDTDKVYFGNSAGHVCRLDPIAKGTPDKTSARTNTPVRLLYVSPKMYEGEESIKYVAELKMRLKGSGKLIGTTPTATVSGEAAQYDKANSTDTSQNEQSRDLILHPRALTDATHTADTYFWNSFTYGSPSTVPAGDGVTYTPMSPVTIPWNVNVVGRWFQYAFDEESTHNRLEVLSVGTKLTAVGDEP